MPASKTKDIIREFISGHLKQAGKDVVLTDDLEILTGGLLDSLFLVDLVLFIEESFPGVKIGLDKVTRDDIDSVNRISEMIEQKRGQV